MEKKKRRGRKPEPKTPLAALVLPKIEEIGLTITGLEQSMQVECDAIRNLLRGKTGRNKAEKFHIAQRLATRLAIPLSEIMTATGLIEVEGKKLDPGTVEAQIKRAEIAGGGDPRLCGTALGVLAARGEVSTVWGISKRMLAAGMRFSEVRQAAMAARIGAATAAGMPPCPLAFVMTDGGGGRAPSGAVPLSWESESLISEREAAKIAAYSFASKALLHSDRTFGKAVVIQSKPSFMVQMTAIDNRLPPFATAMQTDLEGASAAQFMTQWRALRHGLTALHLFFHSDAFYGLTQRMRAV